MSVLLEIPNNEVADALYPDGLDIVRDMMLDSIRKTSLAPIVKEIGGAIGGGKMLRARLAMKVGAASDTPRNTLLRASAAVEMVHAASLLHDDVIDGGVLRRGAPSFWKRKSVSGAILLGDLLVCKAVQMLDGIENGRLAGMLIRLAGEMCDAEAEQELVAYGTTRDWEKCVSLVRRKTGSLFAFAAVATDGSDEKRGEALLEAGYRIGTAYQLADDLMDACGEPVRDGKDLGRDALNGIFTSASASGGTDTRARQCIAELCADSSALLIPWPSAREAWDQYVNDDLGPIVRLFTGEDCLLNQQPGFLGTGRHN